MIRMQREIVSRQYQTNLLLQVHDELVLEAPENEVPDIRKLLKEQMENVEKLRVPLIADVGVGENWRDAK
jgi:DNA polymerase-1